MEAYPEDYVAHNRPLILLSGLETETFNDESDLSVDYCPLLHENGVKVDSDFPPLLSSSAVELRNILLRNDASGVVGSSPDVTKPAKTRSSEAGFKIKSVGRVSGCFVFLLHCP